MPLVTTDWTVNFWVNFDIVDGADGYMGVIQKTPNQFQNSIRMDTSHGSDFRMQFIEGGATKWTLDAGFAPSVDTDYMITLRADGTDVFFYVNNVFKESATFSTDYGDVFSDITLGIDFDASNGPMDGTIDDFSITPFDRGTAWIAARYNSGSCSEVPEVIVPSDMNITLIAPPDQAIIESPVNLTYNVTSFHALINCSAIINGSINVTDSQVIKNLPQQNFTIPLANSTYAWNVSCTDTNEIVFNATTTFTFKVIQVPAKHGFKFINYLTGGSLMEIGMNGSIYIPKNLFAGNLTIPNGFICVDDAGSGCAGTVAGTVFADDFIEHSRSIPESGLYAVLQMKNKQDGTLDHSTFPSYIYKNNTWNAIYDRYGKVIRPAGSKIVEGISLSSQIKYLIRAVQEQQELILDLQNITSVRNEK